MTLPSASSLLIGIVAGAFGMAYFIYGKRQMKFMPMIAGVLLCIYPYLTDSLAWLCAIGVALLVAPFLIDF
jgi:hypothetical protein